MLLACAKAGILVLAVQTLFCLGILQPAFSLQVPLGACPNHGCRGTATLLPRVLGCVAADAAACLESTEGNRTNTTNSMGWRIRSGAEVDSQEISRSSEHQGAPSNSDTRTRCSFRPCQRSYCSSSLAPDTKHIGSCKGFSA